MRERLYWEIKWNVVISHCTHICLFSTFKSVSSVTAVTAAAQCLALRKGNGCICDLTNQILSPSERGHSLVTQWCLTPFSVSLWSINIITYQRLSCPLRTKPLNVYWAVNAKLGKGELSWRQLYSETVSTFCQNVLDRKEKLSWCMAIFDHLNVW